jgi:hypothetical protein
MPLPQKDRFRLSRGWKAAPTKKWAILSVGEAFQPRFLFGADTAQGMAVAAEVLLLRIQPEIICSSLGLLAP